MFINMTQQFAVTEFKPEEVLVTLANTVDQYRWLTINGIEDKAWYTKVYESRQILKKRRSQFISTCEDAREDAVKYQKYVLEKQKEGVAIILEVEEQLQAEESRIDAIKEQIKKDKEAKEQAALQLRVNTLTALNYDFETGKFLTEIQKMTDEEFTLLVQNQRMIFEEEEELRIAEQKRIEEEQESARIQKDKEDQERAAFIEEKRLFDLDKQRLIDDQNRIAQEKLDEQNRIDKIERDRINEENRVLREKQQLADQKANDERVKAQLEKEEQAKNEKKRKVQQFLKENGWTEENKGDFNIAWSPDGKRVALWKCVWELTL